MLLQNICFFIQEVYDQGYSVELITCMLLCSLPFQTFTMSLLYSCWSAIDADFSTANRWHGRRSRPYATHCHCHHCHQAHEETRQSRSFKFTYKPINFGLFKEFISSVDVVLRTSLTRLGGVTASTLAQLIQAAPAQSKFNDSMDVLNTLFDILADGLRVKTKIAPLTLKSLIEVGCSCCWFLNLYHGFVGTPVGRSVSCGSSVKNPRTNFTEFS